LSCNIENDEVAQHMVKHDVIPLLKKILVDSRHDWPTNGAALAILQYSHVSLSNAEYFYKLEQAGKLSRLNSGVYALVKKFLPECRNRETKRHLYETITIMSMARRKMNSIDTIASNNCYASCA
jgi:hypothetical protein